MAISWIMVFTESPQHFKPMQVKKRPLLAQNALFERKKHSRRGFALVVTISLMALLTVIALGVLSLSTVQLRNASHDSDMAVARANARMALAMAIGQLQRHTGSDQRITMTADQLNGSGDGSTSAAIAERRHWTGVYKSWIEGEEMRPTPEFLSWLVSGEDSVLESTESAKAIGSEGTVELVGAGTLGSSTNGQVKAPLISMKSSGGKPTGRLAWWTGDQGVKATLALSEPKLDSENLVRNNLQAAARTGMERVSNGTDKPFKSVNFADPKLATLTSLDQASLLDGANNQKSPLFHDIAAHSTGLLTNVVKGGFRKDLSMELERPSPNDFPLKGNHASDRPDPRLYTMEGSRKDIGINLQELWLHYNIYKELKSGSVKYTTGGSISASTPYLSLPAGPQNAINDPFGSYKLPPVISFQTLLSFVTETVKINGQDKYQMRVVIDPIIVVWNPLDVPVVLPRDCNYSIKYWVIPYDIELSINGQETIRCPLVSSTSSARIANGGSQAHDGDYNFLSFNAGSTEQIVLKPGEVLKISQAGTSGTMERKSGQIGHNLQGKAGFNFGAGVSLPLKTITGANVELNANDRVSYVLRPNDLTAGNTAASGNSLTGLTSHSGHHGLTMQGTYLNTTRGQAYFVGGVNIDRKDFNGLRPTPYAGNVKKPDSERLYATDFPSVFPTFSGTNETLEFNAFERLNNKTPFMLFSYNVKTEHSSTLGTKSLARYNPTATQHDFVDLSQTERDLSPYEINIEPVISWKSDKLEVSPNGQGYFGGSMNAEYGSTYVVTNSIPRAPLISLGALQHAFANGFHTTKLHENRLPLLPEISHPIGNSHAPSAIPPDQVRAQLPTQSAKRDLADHSYLANLALWDDWFFSSVAPNPTENKSQKDIAKKFLETGGGLPVSRYFAETNGKTSAETLGKLFNGDKPTNPATKLMASLMRVEGLFNVNSTSVEAWKAMLSSLAGQATIERDELGGLKVKTIGKDKLSSTALLSARPPADADDAGPGTYWDGGRQLDETEIEQLAQAIVREVRKRGPFLSLADFANRRVGSDKKLALAGALQAAINQTSINHEYEKAGRDVLDTTAGRFAFPDAEKGAISQGIAGILDQADVLTPIAPVLSARSDSFVIRSYGEALDSTGKVKAKAWCEAIVERGNPYVDPADSAEVEASKLNQVNRTFGRPYRVISFRWLTPNEV